MKFRIFISSVQSEFAEERRMLKDYIEHNPVLRRFFEVFIFVRQFQNPVVLVTHEHAPCSTVRVSHAHYGHRRKVLQLPLQDVRRFNGEHPLSTYFLHLLSYEQ